MIDVWTIKFQFSQIIFFKDSTTTYFKILMNNSDGSNLLPESKIIDAPHPRITYYLPSHIIMMYRL